MSDSKAINKYFKQVSDAYRLGNVETAYNGPIVSLIEAFGAQARDLSGSRSQAAGENIDILLWHDGQATNETDAFAGIEVKKADGIDSRAKEQIIAETERFGRAVLTDNLAWYFWALNDGVPQQYSGVHLMDLIDGEPKLRKESVELFISLMQDFLLASPTTISSSTKLAEYMAIHAKTIRSVVIGILKTNDNSQPLTDERQRQLPLFAELFSLYNRIKADLQPSLDTQAFADMYAQTLVYGLFIARYNDESPESFDRFEAIGNLRQEGSLLRLFFSHIATSNIEHPTLEATIDKLCDLYRSVDLRQLLDKDEEKDTIIHFYEDFLTQYDPALKKSLGVYYTPYQVVRYMVRMVDKILVEEFGIEGGLSDNSTIDVELPTEPYMEGRRVRDTVMRAVPRVSILDPAIGTGTFHAEIIRHIHDTYFSGGKEAFWQDYILDKNGLMSRLIGFEIMMTSYVVAHLKVRRTIDETLDGDVTSSAIPGSSIYLTNTLAPPQSLVEESDQLRLFSVNDFSGAITEEAKRADEWKSRRPIKVIIGNPPYNASSTNVFDISAYKFETDGVTKLNERNPKWLNDDYVKFIRFSESIIEKNSDGVLAFITPHGYLDNPTFRGMRASLLRTFDKLFVVNLHGNVKKKEITPDGTKDENVFDIQQGVSIVVAVKSNQTDDWAEVSYADSWGERKDKFAALLEGDIKFTGIQPDQARAFLLPVGFDGFNEYQQGVSIAKLFSVNSIGIVTARDRFTIQDTKEEVRAVIEEFMVLDDESARLRFNLGMDASEWKVKEARNDLSESYGGLGKFVPINYRLFDKKWTFYTGVSGGFHGRPRVNTMNNLLEGDNLGIVFQKSVKAGSDWHHVFITNSITESSYLSNRTSEISYIAPLFLKPEGTETEWRASFDEQELKRLAGNLSTQPEPLQVFDYIYGILHDPNYRSKYNEYLKRDFPRVPVIANQEDKDNPDAFYVSENRFWQYVDAGSRLRRLHLLEDKQPITLTIEPNIPENLEIGAIKYEDGALILNNNKRILGIPETVWDYYIGGYQVLSKWFKSHKGELFDIEKIRHIENVVGALAETIRIQIELENYASG